MDERGSQYPSPLPQRHGSWFIKSSFMIHHCWVLQTRVVQLQKAHTVSMLPPAWASSDALDHSKLLLGPNLACPSWQCHWQSHWKCFFSFLHVKVVYLYTVHREISTACMCSITWGSLHFWNSTRSTFQTEIWWNGCGHLFILSVGCVLPQQSSQVLW